MLIPLADYKELRDKMVELGVIETIITNSEEFQYKKKTVFDVLDESNLSLKDLKFEHYQHVYNIDEETILLFQILKHEENLQPLFKIRNLGSHLLRISERNPYPAAVVISLFNFLLELTLPDYLKLKKGNIYFLKIIFLSMKYYKTSINGILDPFKSAFIISIKIL